MSERIRRLSKSPNQRWNPGSPVQRPLRAAGILTALRVGNRAPSSTLENSIALRLGQLSQRAELKRVLLMQVQRQMQEKLQTQLHRQLQGMEERIARKSTLNRSDVE